MLGVYHTPVEVAEMAPHSDLIDQCRPHASDNAGSRIRKEKQHQDAGGNHKGNDLIAGKRGCKYADGQRRSPV